MNLNKIRIKVKIYIKVSEVYGDRSCVPLLFSLQSIKYVTQGNYRSKVKRRWEQTEFTQSWQAPAVQPRLNIKSRERERESTDINIRWPNVEWVKYCSPLFASHTGCLLIPNPSLSPQTTPASGPIVWNSTLLSQGVCLTPTVQKSKQHIKGRHAGCLQVTGSVRGEGSVAGWGRAASLIQREEERRSECLLSPVQPLSASEEVKPLPFKTK